MIRRVRRRCRGRDAGNRSAGGNGGGQEHIELLGRHRPSEVVALGEVAPQRHEPLGLVDTLLDAVPDGVHAMRDATRGGVATILNEVAQVAGVAVVVDEAEVPVRPEVTGAGEILGIDPLYVACEGRLVAIVDEGSATTALDAMRSHPLGREAAVIGRVAEVDIPKDVQIRWSDLE